MNFQNKQVIIKFNFEKHKEKSATITVNRGSFFSKKGVQYYPGFEFLEIWANITNFSNTDFTNSAAQIARGEQLLNSTMKCLNFKIW